MNHNSSKVFIWNKTDLNENRDKSVSQRQVTSQLDDTIITNNNDPVFRSIKHSKNGTNNSLHGFEDQSSSCFNSSSDQNNIFQKPSTLCKNNNSFLALDDLNEKEIVSIYHRYFPKGTKIFHARCGCGYLHPYITIPSQVHHQPNEAVDTHHQIVHNIHHVSGVNNSNHNKIVIRRNFSQKDMKPQIISNLDPNDGSMSQETVRHEEKDFMTLCNTSNIVHPNNNASTHHHTSTSWFELGDVQSSVVLESTKQASNNITYTIRSVNKNHMLDSGCFSGSSSSSLTTTDTNPLHEATTKNEEYLLQTTNEKNISNLQKQIQELKQKQTTLVSPEILLEKEKQIEQLNNLLNEKEQNIYHLSNELEKVSQEKDYISNNLANGIESNKRILETLESELIRIKNEMCIQEEEFSRKKKQLETELNSNNEQSSTKIQDLQDQLHHITSVNSMLQQELSQSKEQNSNNQAFIESLQSKLQRVSHDLENERESVRMLRSDLENSQTENTSNVNALKKAYQEVKEMNSELDVLKKALSEKQSLVDDLESQLIQARIDMEKSEREATLILAISSLKKELTSLSDQLSESKNYETVLKKQVEDLEKEIKTMNEKQKHDMDNKEIAMKELEEKEQDILKLSESLSEIKTENKNMKEMFENMSHELKNEISQKEAFINSLQKDIEFCREQAQSQNELLKERIDELNLQLEIEKRQVTNFRESSEQYKVINDNLVQEMEILRIDYLKTLETVALKEKEIVYISETFKSLKNEHENCVKEKNMLQTELQRLAEMNCQNEQKLREFKEQVHDLTAEILKRDTLLQVNNDEKQHFSQELQTQLVECREKLAIMTNELKKMNDSYNEKQQSIDILRKELDEFKDICSNQKSEIEKNNETIAEHKNTIQNLSTQLQDYIYRCEHLSNDVQGKDKEISEKMSIIEKHEHTIEDLNSDISQSRKYHSTLQDQITILQEKLSSSITEYNIQIMNLRKECERVVAECKSELLIKEQKNNELNEKIRSIEQKMIENEKLLDEKSQLCEQLEAKLTSNEISKLKKENLELRQYVDEVKQSNDKMHHEVERLLEQITSTKFQSIPFTNGIETMANNHSNVSILSNSSSTSFSDHKYDGGQLSSQISTTSSTYTMLSKHHRGITSTKSPSSTGHHNSSTTQAVSSPFEVWKQLRSEILRLKQKVSFVIVGRKLSSYIMSHLSSY